jgi:hypothetical protein
LSVIEAAGIQHYGNFIWWKEKPHVAPNQARAILVQAKHDGMFGEEIPEDDTQVVAKAEEMIDLAQQAWDALVRGPEVEALLRMASETWSDNGHEAEEADVMSIEESQELEATATEFHTDLFQDNPPWDGYDEAKLREIYEKLPTLLESSSDPEALLAHVETYEKAHKDRMRVTNFIGTLREEDIYVREVAPEEAQEPQAESPREEPVADAAPSEDDLPRETAVEGSEGEGEGHADVQYPEPDALPEPVGEVEEPSDEDRPGEDAAEEAQKDTDYYRELVNEAEREIHQRYLAVPPSIPTDEVELPFDLTTLSDKELQRYHGIYAALAYRASYLMTVEEAKARVCRAAADELLNYLIATREPYDEYDKPKSVTRLEAEANRDVNLKTWRKRQQKHETFAFAHKNARDSYGKVVDSLSRQETMRDNEYQRGR